MDEATKILKERIETERLELGPLLPGHAPFIYELLNSPGWLRFIGNRNITDLDQATRYIARINSDPNVCYWVVSSREDSKSLGIVTFIKRNYLAHPDIGFAFLPGNEGRGYAFEAANALLNYLMDEVGHETILATTDKTNERSIRLLEKLGLEADCTVQVEGEPLLVFAIRKLKKEDGDQSL